MVRILSGDICPCPLPFYQAVNVKWSFGGVPYSLCATASNLVFVRQQLQQLLVNQILVGHGLSKDLAALGLQHPRSLQYDTISHPAFCNKAGNSRNLKWLAKQHLGLDIQSKPANPAKRADKGKRRQKAQHDPEEDAVAVMKLYQQVRGLARSVLVEHGHMMLHVCLQDHLYGTSHPQQQCE